MVGADEVHDDADVGEVDEPEGLVEGEAGEDVARRVVAEGGVAGAAEEEVEDGGHGEAVQRRPLHGLVLRRRRAERVLDLDEHVGEGVGEGHVAEGQEHVEGLLPGDIDGGAGEGAADVAVGGPLGGAEAEADEGVAEGGGDGDDGQPRDVVEAGELREEELEEAEHHHVRAPGGAAVAGAVPLPVEAVHPLHRSACMPYIDRH
uniref:Uncharacterized protein n=1 Tax=Oryza brachyantha TaxID=4533 RepID=J3NC05_ORYBR